MREILVDTPLVIDYLEDDIVDEAEKLLTSNAVAISILTYLEVCKFFYKIGKTKELEFVKQRLKSFKIYELNTDICEEAAQLAHSHSFSVADAIIYATARENDLKLVTSDSDLKGMEGVIFLKQKKK